MWNTTKWDKNNLEWGTLRWNSQESDDGWVSYLDQTYWTIIGSDGSWNGSGWDCEPNTGMLGLLVTGGWEAGFRPTGMRLTYTGTTPVLDLRDSSAGSIVKDLTYTSGEEKDTTWRGLNISVLLVEVGFFNQITVTEIEFYGG